MLNLTRNKSALEFINHGICCNCLVFLSKSSLWKSLTEGNVVSADDSTDLSIVTALESVLMILSREGILDKSHFGFRLSSFGQSLKEYIGLVNMLFEGYAPLMALQGDIAKGKRIHDFSTFINGEAIAEASLKFGENAIDTAVLEEFSKLTFKGTICDLGCGSCSRLLKICQATRQPGIGIERNASVVQQVTQRLDTIQNSLVNCFCGDVTKLEGIWEDVVILMQTMLFHDFTPNEYCIKILNSYLSNFPNLKYFFYIDIVAPSKKCSGIMPGYDYVHGLMGIKTRTYEETIEMFDDSDFKMVKEIPIEVFPNFFIWILIPKKFIH